MGGRAMLILFSLSCVERTERPRFCQRDAASCVEEPNLQLVLLEGCPDTDVFGVCRMWAPVFAVCPELPGECLELQDWLVRAGWYQDPPPLELDVWRCPSRPREARAELFQVMWVDPTWSPADASDLGWRSWHAWFDGGSGDLVSVEYHHVAYSWSDWCCGGGLATEQVWGPRVDLSLAEDCEQVTRRWFER